VDGACHQPRWDKPEPAAQWFKQAAPGRPPPPLRGDQNPFRLHRKAPKRHSPFVEVFAHAPAARLEQTAVWNKLKEEPSVSHHFDSAAARADGRINPCDLYAFPAAPGTTALILTVNPDAGRSSPATFWPDALYEFAVASNGGTSQDMALRVTFTQPGDHGRQQVRVARADGPAACNGPAGTPLGEGRTGAVFPLGDDGLAWAGLATDPFSADGAALSRFFQGLAEGRYTPEVFTDSPSNLFAGRDVTAIALQLPDAALGRTRVALWARINLHSPQRQVSRIGQAMLRPLFYNPFLNDPDTEAELEALNAGPPAADRHAHGERVRRIARAVARLAGLPDPEGHAQRVAAAFLPDVLGYRPGQPAIFHPGGGNGRALGDDAFDIACAVLAGSALGSASAPRLPTAAFPYLSAPQPADLPPIADLSRSS